jgi:hypothetical protein
MKTKLTILFIVASTVVFAQKKKNGNVYIEHPVINVINEMYAAVYPKY